LWQFQLRLRRHRGTDKRAMSIEFATPRFRRARERHRIEGIHRHVCERRGGNRRYKPAFKRGR
jgi:hypothetical protein